MADVLIPFVIGREKGGRSREALDEDQTRSARCFRGSGVRSLHALIVRLPREPADAGCMGRVCDFQNATTRSRVRNIRITL